MKRIIEQPLHVSYFLPEELWRDIILEKRFCYEIKCQDEYDKLMEISTWNRRFNKLVYQQVIPFMREVNRTTLLLHSQHHQKVLFRSLETLSSSFDEPPLPNEMIASLYHLTSLDLSHINTISDEYLKDLTALRILTLFGKRSGLTDQALMDKPHLHTLKLMCDAAITVEGLKALPSLHTLDLYSNTRIEDQHLSLLSSLTSLSLSFNYYISDKGLESLVATLRHLDLTNNLRITAASLSQFSRLESLKLASLNNLDPSTLLLKNLTTVTELNLTNNVRVQDNTLYLLTHLKKLNLSHTTSITDASLQRLTQLERLSLRENKRITGKCFPYMQSLQVLDLCYNKTIHGSAVLLLPKLRKIYIRGARKVNTEEWRFKLRERGGITICL